VGQVTDQALKHGVDFASFAVGQDEGILFPLIESSRNEELGSQFRRRALGDPEKADEVAGAVSLGTFGDVRRY
jgi:hypothetical protein